jgi:hypothetical protein
MGYANIAGVIRAAFEGLAENTLRQSDPASSVSGPGLMSRCKAAKLMYYWRGFQSPVGIPSLPTKPKFGRYRAHPYSRKN